MSDLADALRPTLEARGSLAPSTIKAYVGMLARASRGSGVAPAELAKQTDAVLAWVAEHLQAPATRRTTLAALVVYTGNDAYRQAMLANAAQVQAQYAKNETAPERKEHLLSYEEVVAIHAELVAAANRPTASHEDVLKGLTSYLVSGALGDALPPRRLKDYADMKIRAYDTKSDSYIDGRGVAHFRAYKTVKTHGPQSIRLPPQLTKFLRRWTTQYNETAWLLVNARGERISANAWGRLVSRLFNGCSIDTLRSIYVSHVLAATPPDRLEALAANMGTSKNMLMSVYSKNDAKTDAPST